MKKPLILASGSPQRKRILKELGVSFKAIPSHIDETHDGRTKPFAIVRHIALKKAQEVAAKHPALWVLGVDTLVVLSNGVISGKPANKAEAKKILKTYPGSYCDVYSGIALIHLKHGKAFTAFEKTRIYFNDFSDADIDRYLLLNKWQGSSGAMTIEGVGARWVKRVVGDYWNVVGLPVPSFKKLLTLAQGFGL